jgi:hypothetical protein
MTRLRRLNQTGIQRFTEFLLSLSTDTPQGRPVDILTDSATSEELGVPIEVEARTFGSRFAVGRYLDERFSAAGLKDVESDCGLWAWLALFYFEELCPPGPQGRRKPGELARWIPEVSNFQRYYRHLLAGPYRIYRAHRDCPRRALALLCGPLDRPGEIVEQLASRQELVTNKAIIETATTLYIDLATEKPRRGSGGKAGGSPRRLADVINQLDVTWDLYAVTSDRLLELLPKEFNRFRPKTAASA